MKTTEPGRATARTIRLGFATVALACAAAMATAETPKTILFGAAYYDEYAPVDRLDRDVAMMKAANITVVRIAESTWGTLEPRPGVFDFSHVDRVLNAMHAAGIKVIVGTPTYAIPTWLAREHPDVLVETTKGKALYGPRQNMDITAPAYRQAAERVIVALVSHVRNHPAVIGYQVDNETKAYDTSGPRVQAAFQARMRERFPDLQELNRAYGLNYWSNRINQWEDFPSVNGSINASLSGAFAEFQRELVTEFLAWQARLVRANAQPGQFVSHNFDMDWRGASFGIQPAVDHFAAAESLDVAGIDIYHPGQDKLTGAEIALGGDLARSIKGNRNYMVLETQAQGFPQWTPYPGQLRLQAYSHLANGANLLEYWHWGSTANAVETYWRGLLTQEYETNPTYEEASRIGAELRRLGPKLVDMRKQNRVAIYVSNRALTAFNAFKPDGKTYNDVLRPFYDALYRMNVEIDFIHPGSTDLSAYRMIVVPALYAASDAELARLNAFARNGGHLVYTFKSGFSDEHVKVRYARQPGAIAEAAGVSYTQFTIPDNVSLSGNPFGSSTESAPVRWWMEMLTPTSAKVLAHYQHPVWGKYAAVTRNHFGEGQVTYIGFMPSDDLTEKILENCVRNAGLWGAQQAARFPAIVRSGRLTNGRPVHYLLNYSAQAVNVRYAFKAGTDLLTGRKVVEASNVPLEPWGVAVVEENR